MTRDQMRGECDRLQGVLEAYEARDLEGGIEDRRVGLKRRIEVLEHKLAQLDRA